MAFQEARVALELADARVGVEALRMVCWKSESLPGTLREALWYSTRPSPMGAWSKTKTSSMRMQRATRVAEKAFVVGADASCVA